MPSPNHQLADPLARPLDPDRVVYAQGVLLDASDFQAEQTYHRARLARALAFLVGSGTAAGLEVEWRPPQLAAQPPREEELVVNPGLAVDRLGRLIEVPRRLCIRLDRWFREPARREALERAFYGPGEEVQVAPGLAIQAFVADLFIRYVPCERGRTPAFVQGPFDALDATVASRLRDGWELQLFPRTEHNLAANTPKRLWPTNRNDLPAAIYGAWERAEFEGPAGNLRLKPLDEHLEGQDPTFVFLARIVMPGAEAAGQPQRTDPTTPAGVVRVLNDIRPFAYSTAALAALAGL